MRIVLYGGSFNPPHLGHRAAAMRAAESLSPDRFLVMPTRLPPHKELPAGSPSPEERLRLCELAFDGIPGLEVSDLELRREGASYTADTVDELRQNYPQDELILLLGADMLLCFEKWYRFRDLLRACSLAVLSRAGGEREALEAAAAHLRESCGAKVRILEHEPIEMSSAQIRALLPQRLGADCLSGAVYAEIIRRRFYGAKPDLHWLREQGYALLKPKRVPHVAGCEKTAAALAERWGEDPALAAEAAILHDATKRCDAQEQLRLCEEYGVALTDDERACPEVLHAITAAALAADRFGAPAEVQSAIRWHCTGKPGMTTLEKIVWLADYTEPTRDFPGVDKVRKLSQKDLDRAMAAALDLTLKHIKEDKYKLCGITEQARDYYAGLTDRR